MESAPGFEPRPLEPKTQCAAITLYAKLEVIPGFARGTPGIASRCATITPYDKSFIPLPTRPIEPGFRPQKDFPAFPLLSS